MGVHITEETQIVVPCCFLGGGGGGSTYLIRQFDVKQFSLVLFLIFADVTVSVQEY